MSEHNFMPEWYNNLNKIHKSFEPAIKVADNLKWIREMTGWKNSVIGPLSKEAFLKMPELSKEIKEMFLHNHSVLDHLHFTKNHFTDELFSKTFFSLENSLGESLKAISKNTFFLKDIDLLKAFNDTSEKIAATTAEIPEKDAVTKEDLQQIQEQVKQLSQSLMEKLDEGFDGRRAQINWHLTIISFIIGLYSLVLPYIEATKKQGTSATAKQVEAIRSDVKKLIDSALNNHATSAFARIAVNLRLKPSTRSLTIARVKADEKVHVLLIHHKWAQITIIDKDGLPVTGWILKKYLLV